MTDRPVSRVAGWIDAHGGHLYALARALSADIHDAEDLMQEVWVVAVQREHMLKTEAHMGPWLHRVAVNLARARDRKRRRRHLLRLQWLVPTTDSLQASEAMESEAERVYRAIAELPPLQRDVAYLRLVEDRSTADTATALGRAEGTVKASLHRALKTLRKVLSHEPPPTQQEEPDDQDS